MQIATKRTSEQVRIVDEIFFCLWSQFTSKRIRWRRRCPIRPRPIWWDRRRGRRGLWGLPVWTECSTVWALWSCLGGAWSLAAGRDCWPCDEGTCTGLCTCTGQPREAPRSRRRRPSRGIWLWATCGSTSSAPWCSRCPYRRASCRAPWECLWAVANVWCASVRSPADPCAAGCSGDGRIRFRTRGQRKSCGIANCCCAPTNRPSCSNRTSATAVPAISATWGPPLSQCPPPAPLRWPLPSAATDPVDPRPPHPSAPIPCGWSSAPPGADSPHSTTIGRATDAAGSASPIPATLSGPRAADQTWSWTRTPSHLNISKTKID